MSQTTNTTIQQSLFAASSGQVSGGSISRVVCLLEPKAILVAGMNAQGEVFSAKSYTGATEWDTDFFTSICRNELLLRDTKLIKSVYVATHKQVIVPDALYQADQAGALLRHMYHIQYDEQVQTADNGKTRTVYALPAEMFSLMQQLFGKAPVVPLTAGLCGKAENRQAYHADCILTQEKAFTALYINGALCWHQVFDYTNAEDIAYQLAAACRQNNISMADLFVNCSAVHESLTAVISELETYYPKIKYAGGSMPVDEKQWLPVLYLLQQLNLCAS